MASTCAAGTSVHGSVRKFFEIKCLRHHGLFPGDPRFAQAWDKIPQVDEGDPDPPQVDLDGLPDRWVQSGYEIVTTDGATARQENHALGKSGILSFLWHGETLQIRQTRWPPSLSSRTRQSLEQSNVLFAGHVGRHGSGWTMQLSCTESTRCCGETFVAQVCKVICG